MDRYHRQVLLPQIGVAGQKKLGNARILLVGCGALGTVIADLLARAGAGFLRIVDRDLVELTNLQRQVLFDESDAARNLPKAIAAGNRLRAVNSSIAIEPVVADVDSSNVEALAKDVDLILDGTDNVSTRYLLNEVAVKHQINWVYGAAVATEGRVMAILPGRTPCLRCVFPEVPLPGELPTCDTVGVLGAVASVVASLQVIAAIKLLAGHPDAVANQMTVLELWSNRIRTVNLEGAKPADCVNCGLHRYEFLDATTVPTTLLCGRDAVQMRGGKLGLDLDELERQLERAGVLTRTPYFLRVRLSDPAGIELTVFPDGRTIVRGTTDAGRARAIFSRFVGD